MRSFAIIMAGGAGERFWPLSRAAYPKQLLKISGAGQSMLSAAVDRLAPLIPPADCFIITGRALKPAIEAELPQVPAANIIGEPAGRNTAACLALALAHVQAAVPAGEDALMAVLTADHFVPDPAAFAADFQVALQHAAAHPALVTFGMVPTRAETGYGYIQVGESVPGAHPQVLHVSRFCEKPDAPTAEAFVADGGYLWNSGLFVWRASVLEAAFAELQPEIAAQLPRLRDALARQQPEALEAAFSALPKISIDYAIMEKAANVACVRAGFAWDDIGTWTSLQRLLPPDEQGNVTYGAGARAYGCERCVVYDAQGAESRKVVIGFGLQDVVIVQTPDAVLVLPAAAAQEVKQVVAQLKAEGREGCL